MENLLNYLYRLKSLLLMMFSILILASCGGGSSNPSLGSSNEVRTLENDLVSITISSSNLTAVYPGSIVQFNATAHYRGGKTEDVTTKVNWSSSNTNVATINSDGSAIAGTALGTTDIRAAKDGVKSNILALNVVAPAATVVSLVISPEAVRIAKDTTQQYKATAVYSDGTLINVTSDSHTIWTSSDTSIATISNDQATDGLATGVAPGVDVITAKYTDNQGHTVTSEKSNVTVTNALITSIEVTPAGASLPLGINQEYTATATFTDSTKHDVTNVVTWSSSNEGVATITTSGLAKSVGIGTTTIIATSANGVSGNVSGNTTLEITNKVLTRIHVTPTDQTIPKGTTQQYTAMGTYSDGTSDNITDTVDWTTKDGSIATINNTAGINKGLATGVGAGSTDIIATLGSVSGSTGLTVTAAVLNKIVVTPPTATIAAGIQQQYKATGYYSDGGNQDITASVTWLSSNDGVATITNSATPGLATTLAPGSTTISASQDGVSSDTSNTSASLTVTDATLVSIAVSTNTPSIPAGTTAKYTATGTYSNGSTSDITALVAWGSDNEGVATIAFDSEQNTAVANGLSQGTANISASMNGVTGTSQLTVTAAVLQSLKIITPGSTVESIPVDVNQRFQAIGMYANGESANLTNDPNTTWRTSDANIVSVRTASVEYNDQLYGKGIAIGLFPGDATITATYNDIYASGNSFSASTNLTVNDAKITSISISVPHSYMLVGESMLFQVTGMYDNGVIYSLDGAGGITWSSSNTTAINFVTSNFIKSEVGLATAKARGVSTITVTYDNGTDPELTAQESISVITAGNPWTTVDAPFKTDVTVSSFGFMRPSFDLALDADDNPILVYDDAQDGSKAKVFKYNDGLALWGPLGGESQISAGAAPFPTLSVYQGVSGDSVYVFYTDNSLSGNNRNQITGKKFDGTTWSIVQSGVHGSQDDQPDYWLALALDKDGVPFIGFHEDSGSPNNEVYNYNGTSFSRLGLPAYKGDSHSLSLAVGYAGINGTYLAYIDNNFEPVLSYQNSNSIWTLIHLNSTTNNNKGEFTSIVTNPSFYLMPWLDSPVYATFQEQSGASGSGKSNIVFEVLFQTTKTILDKFSINTTQLTTYNDLAISPDENAVPVLSYIDEHYQVAVLYWDASTGSLKPVGQNPVTQDWTTVYTRPKVAVGKNKIWVAFADSGGMIHLKKIDRSSGFKK